MHVFAPGYPGAQEVVYRDDSCLAPGDQRAQQPRQRVAVGPDLLLVQAAAARALQQPVEQVMGSRTSAAATICHTAQIWAKRRALTWNACKM